MKGELSYPSPPRASEWWGGPTRVKRASGWGEEEKGPPPWPPHRFGLPSPCFAGEGKESARLLQRQRRGRGVEPQFGGFIDMGAHRAVRTIIDKMLAQRDAQQPPQTVPHLVS